MKILRSVLYMGMMACLLWSGSAWAQAGGAPSAGNTHSPQGMGSPRSQPGNSSDSEVQGRIVYINKITGQIIVMDENNVKRPVKISAIQMRRLQVGQGVDISLRGGSISAQSIHVMRRNLDRFHNSRFR